MRDIGIVVVIIGIVWAIYAFNLDTTVTTPGFSSGSIHIASAEVHNIGLMENRRNHLMLAAFTTLVGIVLFGFGSLQPQPQAAPVEPADPTKRIAARGRPPTPAQTTLMGQFGITYSDGSYVIGEHRYESLDQAVIYARALKKVSSQKV